MVKVSVTDNAAMKSLKDLESEQQGHDGQVRVEYLKDIAVLTMDRGENRMNDGFVDQMNVALDAILERSVNLYAYAHFISIN